MWQTLEWGSTLQQGSHGLVGRKRNRVTSTASLKSMPHVGFQWYPLERSYSATYEVGWSSLSCTVFDVTWMSDQSVHLAKWLPALEQVTARHLVKCPHKLTTWPSAIQDLKVLVEFFGVALGQVVHSGTQLSDSPHCKMWQISDFDPRHLTKWHASALSQVISHTEYVCCLRLHSTYR